MPLKRRSPFKIKNWSLNGRRRRENRERKGSEAESPAAMSSW